MPRSRKQLRQEDCWLVMDHVRNNVALFHEKMDTKAAAVYLANELKLPVNETHVAGIFKTLRITPLLKQREYRDTDRVRILGKRVLYLYEYLKLEVKEDLAAIAERGAVPPDTKSPGQKSLPLDGAGGNGKKEPT
jgi:hypothetical protein